MAGGTSVHVLGGNGALGLLFAAHLARAGNRVTLLLRDEALAAFRAREGPDGAGVISVERRGGGGGQGGEATTTTATVRAEPARATKSGGGGGGLIENLIVATKAPDARQALRDLAPRLSPDRSVGLLLCNGVLALRDELLRGRPGDRGAPTPPPPPLPLARLLVASVSHGAYRVPAGFEGVPTPFSAVHAGVGECVMGDLGGLEDDEEGEEGDGDGAQGAGGESGGGGNNHSQPMPELARALEAAGPLLAARWEPDRGALRRALLSKLTINCAANAAAGLLRCHNGGMLPGVNPAAAELQGRVVDECVSALGLARTFGFLRDKGGGNESAAAAAAAAAAADAAAGQALRRTVDEALTRTRGNVNSLLQDLLAGRRTEVDYLNGWVAREAARRRRRRRQGGGGGDDGGAAWGSAPLNEALALLVRAAEGVPAGEGVHGR